VKQRIINQQLAGSEFGSVGELVKYFCGMQAQDFHHAKWAVGVRLHGTTEKHIDNALNKKEIIRTWPMRSTLHFIAADDYHWLMDLLAPKRKAAAKPRNRQLGLDDKLLTKCNNILLKELKGKHQLTRSEIGDVLAASDIKTNGMQLSHILSNAALEKLIIFGKRKGKQFTFTLTDEWIKDRSTYSRDEALAELAGRYFRSRGPASLDDFIWWSGLTKGEARRALESVKSSFIEENINGSTYWLSVNTPSAKKSKKVLLLPAFDEYLISYKDRSAVLDPLHKGRIIYINGIFYPVIIINGIVQGMWKRIMNEKTVIMKLEPFSDPYLYIRVLNIKLLVTKVSIWIESIQLL
jgi:hypothetical protein